MPAVNDNVKKFNCLCQEKNVLLLSKVIERGLGKEATEDDNIFNITSKETIEELITISSELLEKAGLTEMNQKLNMLK